MGALTHRVQPPQGRHRGLLAMQFIPPTVPDNASTKPELIQQAQARAKNQGQGQGWRPGYSLCTKPSLRRPKTGLKTSHNMHPRTLLREELPA